MPPAATEEVGGEEGEDSRSWEGVAPPPGAGRGWPPATPGEVQEGAQADLHERGEAGEAGEAAGWEEEAPRTWEELQRRSDLHARRAAETAAAAATAAAAVQRLESLFRLPSASASASNDGAADSDGGGGLGGDLGGGDADDVRYPMGEA